jgi:hypothetical protein
MLKVLKAVSLAIAVYGMAGWIYVAICGIVVPETLHLPLTHLAPGIREDTSGVIAFFASFSFFVVYRLIDPDRDRVQSAGTFSQPEGPVRQRVQ